MTGSWALQVAIFDLLRLGGITGGRIYDADAVPVDVSFPYVTIGATEALNFDVVGQAGSDEYLPLHIWDRSNPSGGQRGGKNISEIADRLNVLLNAKRIDVLGREWAFCVVRDFRKIPDPDPLTTHGVMTLRVQHFATKES